MAWVREAGLDWDDARVFLAVAREGQLLAAARRLGVNHATVGRRLTALETALGVQLMERGPAGCVLTGQGERFMRHAERMEAGWQGAEAELEGRGGPLSGRVRIGAPDGFGTFFLAPRLSGFLNAHPGLDLELVPVSRSFSLSRREADIAITVDRPDIGRLAARKLVDYGLGLYASPTYLDAAGRPAGLADLRDHFLIGPVEDLLHSPSVAYAGDLGIDWGSRLDVSSALGQMQAAVGGAGIAILHDFIAARTHGLERVLPQASIRRSYWLVVHESSRETPRVRAVGDYVTDLVKAERHCF